MPRDPDKLLKAYNDIIQALADYNDGSHDSTLRDAMTKELRKAFRQFVNQINDELTDIQNGG